MTENEVILGPAGSGKTFLALKKAHDLTSDANIVRLTGVEDLRKPVISKRCNKDTYCVIVEQVELEKLYQFFAVAKFGLPIRKKGSRNLVIIHPKFIFTAQAARKDFERVFGNDACKFLVIELTEREVANG